MDITELTVYALIVAAIEIPGFYLIVKGLGMFQQRLDTILPKDATPGRIMADGIVALAARINDPKDDAGKIIGQLIYNSAEVAYTAVAAKIPALGGSEALGNDMAKIAKKNPYIGVALELGKIVLPMVQDQLTRQQGDNGGGGRAMPPIRR
jgi:hypothetical protein